MEVWKQMCQCANSIRIAFDKFWHLWFKQIPHYYQPPRGAGSVKGILKVQAGTVQPDISFLSSSSPRVVCAIQVYTRIESQARGLVHRTEKTGSDPFRSRIVSYCSIGIYVLDARFAPSTGRQPPGFDPRRPPRHFRRDCRKVQDKVISYFRLPLSGLAILELSVIDGPWRTYRLLTCSQNYSEFMLLRVTAWTRTVNKNACHDIYLFE